jgi:hypothetical protein
LSVGNVDTGSDTRGQFGDCRDTDGGAESDGDAKFGSLRDRKTSRSGLGVRIRESDRAVGPTELTCGGLRGR